MPQLASPLRAGPNYFLQKVFCGIHPNRSKQRGYFAVISLKQANMTKMDKETLVLLTGASGYVGGRLLKALESAGQPVRCLARRPEFLLPKAGPKTEVIAGDVLDRASLAPAL